MQSKDVAKRGRKKKEVELFSVAENVERGNAMKHFRALNARRNTYHKSKVLDRK